MLPVKQILCSTDFSPPSLAAMSTASELAQHFGAELLALHVVPFAPPLPPDMAVVVSSDFYPSDRERAATALKRLEGVIQPFVDKGIRVRGEVRMGHAAHEIVDAADELDVDMIVIGTHGETGWRRLAFGSVAESVVRLAQRPVLTVHSGPKDNDKAKAREEKK